VEAHRVIRARSGSGLGDSLYLRPVVDHLIRRGERVTALSDYPDVFLGSGATVEPFRRHHFDLVAHYVGGKTRPNTTIWQDVCIEARLSDVEFAFAWKVRNRERVDEIRTRAAGRPMIIVHGGREPMGRTDGFGREMLPERRGFVAALEALDGCFTVRVGKGAEIYSLPVDLDLSNQTGVADMLDLARKCDGVVAQCSFALPLAECFDKPFLGIWAARGLASSNPFIRTVTPQKMLSKPATSRHIADDWPEADIAAAVRAHMPVERIAA
jgi:hypothetical protein